MAENNSPPPLMTDKELLMEDSAHSEIMAAAFEYADAYCSSGDEPRRYKAAIDNLRKTVRAEIARFSRGNYKAPQPQVEPADDDPTSKAQYRRMFTAACEALGAINEALGLDPDDGGAEPIIGAIEELRAALATTQPAAAVNQQLTADQQTGGIKSDEDCILVPRGLLGAACSALARHGESPKTLHELRRYTVGDLSKAQPAPVGEYPALPEPATWLIERGAFRVSSHGQDAESNEWLEEAHEPGEKGSFAVYTEQQLKDFADATHAMRAGSEIKCKSEQKRLATLWGFVPADVRAGEQEPVAYLWQHTETGRTRVVMPDAVITADATWIVVGPLYLSPVATQGEQRLIDALQRARDWMDSQADSQSKGNHSSFDMLMLREERDAIDAALSATTPPTQTKE